MIELSVEQTGLDEVIARLQNAETVVADPISFCKEELIAWFRAYSARMFATEGSSGRSGRWERLKPRTERFKQRHFPGRPILERTGRLKRSLTGNTGDSIVRSGDRQLILGSSVPYGRFHQRGDGLPRRSPIDITNKDAAEVASIVRRKIAAAMRGQPVGAAA